MRLWKLPGPVVRILLIFILAVAALVAIRSAFTPESFGEIGHYRAAAVPQIAAQPISYAECRPASNVTTIPARSRRGRSIEDWPAKDVTRRRPCM